MKKLTLVIFTFWGIVYCQSKDGLFEYYAKHPEALLIPDTIHPKNSMEVKIYSLLTDYKQSLDEKYYGKIRDWIEIITNNKFGTFDILKSNYRIEIDSAGTVWVWRGNNLYDTIWKEEPTFDGFLKYLKSKQ